MLITKLNPQNPDFAESEGSGGKTKNKRSLFRAKSRLHEPVTLADARYSVATLLTNLVTEEKRCRHLRKRFRRFLFLRQVFPYSQKVTQAELFASARFTRLRYVCFITNK